MSQMMVDEEEVKARETEKAGNDLGRPSIGGNEQVPFTYGPNKLECLSPASNFNLVQSLCCKPRGVPIIKHLKGASVG
jgi:hypothetical protein